MLSGDLSQHLGKYPRVGPRAEESRGAPEPMGVHLYTKCFVCPELCPGHRAEGGGARGGGLAGEEEHTRSLRKKSLFVQISPVPLTAPSLPTGEATGAP